METPPKVENPIVSRDNLDFGREATFGLRLVIFSGIALQVVIKGYTKRATFSFNLTPGSTGAQQTFDFPLTDIPIAASVRYAAYTLQQFRAYASLSLTINGDIMHELCAGSISGNSGISYPVSNNSLDVPGRGLFIWITGTDPAAGSEATITTPSGSVFKPHLLRFQLVTDANVANRRVHLVVTSGVSTLLDLISSVDQPASTTRNYSVLPIGGAGTYSDDNDIIIPLPIDIFFQGGVTISTSTTNKQATDNFSAIDLQGEQFWARTA